MFGIAKYKMGVIAALLAFALAACDNDEGPSDEPQFRTMQVTVGAQVVNVRKSDCNVTGGPIVIGVGPINVSASFLLANNSTDPLVNDDDFVLTVTELGAAVATFASTGAFSGVLTGIGAGTTSGKFGLFHNEEQHHELQCVVAIEVQ